MNDFVKKTVTGLVAGAGTFLAAWGVVPADTWATVSPDLIAGVSATVGVIVAGAYNWAVGKIMQAMAPKF